LLREFDARGLIVKNAGHKNHNPRKGHDDEGCSHTEDGDKALFHRVLNLRYGVRVGRRTHTGFIRKEPAGHTETPRFGNREGLLPEADGRTWYECDVNYMGGFRGAERLLYSSDGLIYYTDDHYASFTLVYGEEETP